MLSPADLIDRPDLKRLPPSMVETNLPGTKTAQPVRFVSALPPVAPTVGKLQALPSLSSARGTNVGVSASGSEIEDCVSKLFELLELYGMAPRTGRNVQCSQVNRAFRRTVEHWGSQAASLGEGGWMKYTKWKFPAFFHAMTSQLDVGPVAPATRLRDDPKQLCAGVAGRYALRLCRADSFFRDSFLASILQVKKGCPRPNKEMVDAQVKKSVAALTTKQPESKDEWLMGWGDLPQKVQDKVEIRLCKQSQIEQFERTVDEIFTNDRGEPLTYNSNDKFRPFFPSTSATFNDSQKQGGAFRSIRRLADDLGLTTYGLVRDGKSLVKFSLASGEEYIGAPRTIVHADLTELEARFGDLYEQALHKAMGETPWVKPVGLAESLKVRVITKGPPCTGFVLKPLQKFMWRTLQKHPAFTLIGQPVDRFVVQNRLGAKLAPGEAILSGDYSAATDNLAPWVSEAIARRIALRCGLDARETELLVRSLTQHVFEGENRSALPQQWGQLMGSVTSFPVLCIANAAMCRWSLELAYAKSMKLSQTTLLVNGDDCLFRTTLAGLGFWKKITTHGGLTPSIGKYFFSREFAQVNSTNFTRLEVPDLDLDPVSGKFRELFYRQTPYINLGLLFGLKRSGEKLGLDAVADSDDSLGSRCRELVACAPENLKEVLFKRFVRNHKAVLDSVRVPWFLPESWGGVGLPCSFKTRDPGDPLEVLRGPSSLDLRIAARIAERPETFPVTKPPVDAPWNAHRLAKAKYPIVATSISGDRTLQLVNDKLYGALIVDTLFTATDVFAEKPSRRVAVLRQNERSWRSALHSGSLPPPLSISTVLSQNPPTPLLDVTVESIFI